MRFATIAYYQNQGEFPNGDTSRSRSVYSHPSQLTDPQQVRYGFTPSFQNNSDNYCFGQNYERRYPNPANSVGGIPDCDNFRSLESTRITLGNNSNAHLSSIHQGNGSYHAYPTTQSESGSCLLARGSASSDLNISNDVDSSFYLRASRHNDHPAHFTGDRFHSTNHGDFHRHWEDFRATEPTKYHLKNDYPRVDSHTGIHQAGEQNQWAFTQRPQLPKTMFFDGTTHWSIFEGIFRNFLEQSNINQQDVKTSLYYLSITLGGMAADVFARTCKKNYNLPY